MILGSRKPPLGGSAEPLHRFNGVLVHAETKQAAAPEFVLSGYRAPFGSRTEPFGRLGWVLFHSAPLGVRISERLLSSRVSLLCPILEFIRVLIKEHPMPPRGGFSVLLPNGLCYSRTIVLSNQFGFPGSERIRLPDALRINCLLASRKSEFSQRPGKRQDQSNDPGQMSPFHNVKLDLFALTVRLFAFSLRHVLDPTVAPPNIARATPSPSRRGADQHNHSAPHRE